MGFPPAAKCRVPGDHLCIIQAVCQVKLPVTFFNIRNEVPYVSLEICQYQVIVDAGNHDPLADPGNPGESGTNRTGNAGVINAGSCQERLAIRESRVSGIGRGKQLAGGVTACVVPVMRQGKLAAVRECFGQTRLKLSGFLCERTAGNSTKERAVLHLFGTAPEHVRSKCSIKCRQCRLDTTRSTQQHVGFLDGRVINRRGAIRII